jgi:hypothetical protein
MSNQECQTSWLTIKIHTCLNFICYQIWLPVIISYTHTRSVIKVDCHWPYMGLQRKKTVIFIHKYTCQTIVICGILNVVYFHRIRVQFKVWKSQILAVFLVLEKCWVFFLYTNYGFNNKVTSQKRRIYILYFKLFFNMKILAHYGLHYGRTVIYKNIFLWSPIGLTLAHTLHNIVVIK